MPLPPGIIDVTIQEVIDAVGNIGGNLEDFIKDPIGTLGDLGGWVYGKVEEVFGGDADDPGWGGTLGGFEDWVKGTLGGIVGGAVLVNVYDSVKGIFNSNTNTNTTIIPGGAPTDEEPTPTPKQGDDIVDLGGSSTAVVRPDDIFVDTTDDPDTNELLFGGRNQTDVVGGTRDLTFVDGDDKDDRRKTEIGGGGGGGDGTRTVVDNTKILLFDPQPPEPDPIGGYVDPQTPEPIEIGGPIPPPVSSGGGGSVGGGTGTSDPFVRAIQYTPTVPVAIRQQAPVDYASGLMSPNTSMDAIGQLIYRNLA